MRNRALLAVWVVGVTTLLSLVLGGCLGGGGGGVAKEFTPTSPITAWDDADWQTVLDQVCTPDGMVKYDLLTNNANGVRDTLYRYVGRINQVSPENRPELFPTEAGRLAYWVNAYNALCMYGVLQKGLPGNVALSGLYQFVKFPVGGKEMSLDTLEKTHVRPSGDPRIHFALNCMSKSCPPLRKEVYAGAKLDQQFDEQGRIYLSDPRGVQKASATKVKLSEIFTRFYPADFTEAHARRTGKPNPSLLDSIRPFAAPDSPVQTATEYESMKYDWSLNRG